MNYLRRFAILKKYKYRVKIDKRGLNLYIITDRILLDEAVSVC